MNFIAATVELRQTIQDPINAYGLEYRGLDAVLPASNGNNEVKLRVLCYNRPGQNLIQYLIESRQPCSYYWIPDVLG